MPITVKRRTVIGSGCSSRTNGTAGTTRRCEPTGSSASVNAFQDVFLPSLDERVSNLEERVSTLENAGEPSPSGDDVVPEWVRPTSKDTMYNKGDLVMFNGKKYKCVKNNVSTSPEEDSS